MDILAILRENNLSSPLFVLSTIFFVLFIIKQTKSLFFKNIKNLPPSPPTWPIIGNLHQMGTKPHISITNLAKEHGPLMSLHFGKQLIVVASSPEAAMEVLKTQDRVLSSRMIPKAFHHSSLLPHSLLWSDCNQTWKTLRTLLRAEMFSPKAMEANSGLREENLDRLLDFLRNKQGETVNVQDFIFTTLFNTLSSMIFSKDFLNLKYGRDADGGLKDALHMILEYGGKNDLSDFFPVFRILDLQGIKKESFRYMKKVFTFWDPIIKERRTQMGTSTTSLEHAKSLLDRMIEDGFSDNQIYQFLTELFIAGTDTTTTTVVWTVAELLKNTDVMSKVQEEIKREIDTEKITESQVSKLTYLHACIKETLRIHPTGPFLIPHHALETCEVMDYTIPKNTGIFVNIWAISRDPKIWDDPLSFKPERFLGSKYTFGGQDFEFIPFGAGRRMCPGLPMGVKSVELILASLVHQFDWGLPNGGDPTEVDMNDMFGLTLQKEKPLDIIFRQKQNLSVA